MRCCLTEVCHLPCLLLKKHEVLNHTPFWVSDVCHGVKKSPLVSSAGHWWCRTHLQGWLLWQGRAAHASLCKMSFCTTLSSFSWRLIIFLKPWNYFPESYKTPWGCCGLSFPDEVFSWPNPLYTDIHRYKTLCNRAAPDPRSFGRAQHFGSK